MVDLLLPLHDGLRSRCRVMPLSQRDARWRSLELALLITAGVLAAAASTLVDFNWKLPGSAIFRSVFPLVCGLGLVPRRRAGCLMGVTAFVSVLVFQTFGLGDVGPGALTSLSLTGPLLDLALSRARRTRSIFLGFAAAGLASNLVAFVVRGAAKLGTEQFAGGRMFELWIGPAAVSYPLCGALAGLLSAAVWFQLTPRSPKVATPVMEHGTPDSRESRR